MLEAEELVACVMEPQGAIELRPLATRVSLRLAQSKANLDLSMAQRRTAEEHHGLSRDTLHRVEHPILDTVLAKSEAANEYDARPEQHRLSRVPV